MDINSSRSLEFYLSQNLPTTCRFDVHHLSTPPIPCPALYSAPPGQAPEKTFCESHFLSVSVASTNRPLQVFAVEVLIYTTEFLTTLFVSKADSTGYLHLLNLPKGTPSPFKTIASTFLSFLIENRRRPATKLVLSLFARAQDQYLFPGSIENPRKHVLSDRALVKWWCQVLDPILLQYPSAHLQSVQDIEPTKDGADSYTSQGFLRVPGCDPYETRAFFPNQRHGFPLPSGRWKASDPLRDLGRSETLPARCLIPRFPDDPKARFVDELDDELPIPLTESSSQFSEDQNSGRWRSVRSLDEFWEMMAFRQECSAGRLVGFLWGLFTPAVLPDNDEGIKRPRDECKVSSPEREGSALSSSQSDGCHKVNLRNETTLDTTAGVSLPPPTSLSSEAMRKPMNDLPSVASSTINPNTDKKPSSPIHTSEPRPLKDQPERTKFYYWPMAGRGAAVLREKDYRRIGKLLIHLDYADENIAAESTARWISEVGIASEKPNWGTVVCGRQQNPIDVKNHNVTITPGASMLDTALMRKKRRDVYEESSVKQANGAENGVHVLPLGHIRKKPKERWYI